MAISYPLAWPKCFLRPSNVKISIQSPSRGGGQSLSGQEQVVKSPAFRWAITYTDVALYTADQIRVFRALEALLDGRANSIIIPIYDGGRGPTPLPNATFSDDSMFSDGSEFTQANTVITLTADASAQDTALAVSWPSGGPAPIAGQHFSLGQRLYRVGYVDAADGATTGTLTIRPWLRDAWPTGTQLEFDEPSLLARLAKDDGMALDLELWRFGKPSIDFVEYF